MLYCVIKTITNMVEWTKCFAMFDQMSKSFKFYQTRFNTIKQGVQRGEYLIVFDRQTFPAWTEQV